MKIARRKVADRARIPAAVGRRVGFGTVCDNSDDNAAAARSSDFTQADSYPSGAYPREISWSILTAPAKARCVNTFIEVARYLNILFLSALALVLFVQWRTRRDRPSLWAWLTLAVLALGFSARRVVPDDPQTPLLQLADKLTLVLLLLFPYMLYRTIAAFEGRRRWLDVAALVLTTVVVVWMLLLPGAIEPMIDADPRPAWFVIFIVVVVFYWLTLSFIVAGRSWRSGRGSPPIARKRMEMLSVASIVLSLAIVLVAFVSGERPPAVDVTFRLLLLASGPLFFVAFAPPPWLRAMWRRHAEEEFRTSVVDLVVADNRDDIAERVLAHAEHLVGAQGSAIVDRDGTVVAARNLDPQEDGTSFDLAFTFGSLKLRMNPYTPYFGTQEIDLVRSLGAVADLAFQRIDAAEQRREFEQERLQRDRTAADEANRAKTEFLSRMSHELRTPLNAVLGFAQLLELDAVTAEQKESTSEIIKAGRHLLDLITEVLDITAIEAGKLTLSLEPVDAVAVAEECVSLVAPLASREGIRLSLEAQDHEISRDHVVADRQRLKQVLLNLISNGIKYNREQGQVRISFVPGVDGRLRIDVADTGNGIDAARLPQLFTPFDRLGAEGSSIEGTGLGLALSKSLVEAMGGTISVATEVGKGTTFSVELARTEAPHEAPAETALSEPGAEEVTVGLPSKKVLYIEDNLSNIRLIERLMSRRPHVELITAMQGGIGLILAREQKPDLILLDVNLPDIAGPDVLSRLQADPQTAAIPVVMLSADATPGQINRLLDAGARDYLTKPLDLPRFYDVVDTYCAQSTPPPSGGTATVTEPQ